MQKADSKPPAHLAYRADIDGLRAVAIISVVFFHTYPTFLKGGFIGVDVFFVISGFLISSHIFKDIDAGCFSFKYFYARRIKRIYPSLLFVLASIYLFGWFSLFSEEFKQLGKHIAATAAFVSNIIYWNEAGYFDSSAELKPLLNMWSLGVEEQYYIFWPVIVWAAWKRRYSLCVVSVFLIVLTFVFNIYQSRVNITADFYSPATRFWELLSGGVLAILIKKNNAYFENIVAFDVRRNAASFLGFSGLLVSFVLLNDEMLFPGLWAAIPVVASVMLIYAGPDALINRHILSGRFMVWVGKISYPLYLWHWPLISLVYILENGNPSRLQKILAVILSLLFSWVTYRFIELPIRHGHNRKTTFFLALSMSALGALGLLSYYSDGIPFRHVNKYKSNNRFDTPYKESCEPLIKSKIAENEWCNRGSSMALKPNTVLIGDSFSNAYSPMLQEFFDTKPVESKYQAFSFVQLGHGSCPPFRNFGPEGCRVAADEYYEYVKNNKDISTVILAANWPSYLSDDSRPWGEYKESVASAVSSISSTIAQYQLLNRRVIVFLSPPQGFSPKSCLSRPFALRDKKCNLPVSDILKNEKSYREILLPILKKYSVEYFDPFDYFCDEHICRVESGGSIFSVDGHHLSVLGGVYLATEGKLKLMHLLSTGSAPKN